MPQNKIILYGLQAASSEMCNQKQRKDQVVLHLPPVLAVLFRSNTEGEEFNRF